jgi:signal peptidase II
MKARNYLTLLGVSGTVIALDQWSKYLVRMRLGPSEQWSPWEWLEPYVRIINSTNTGAAFGIFQDGALFFTILAVVVSIAIIFYFPQVPTKERALRVALSLQLGGAVGNLLDRLLQDGKVTDFVSVGQFPVFNVADASISLGVAVLLLSTFFSKPEEMEPEEAQTPVEPSAS